MRLLNGFTYLDTINKFETNTTFSESGEINGFSFPLNVNEYNEEVFEFGHKFGPYFSCEGDVDNKLLIALFNDEQMRRYVTFQGEFCACNVNNAIITNFVNFTINNLNGLSCAAINKSAWNASVAKWGSSAHEIFESLNTLYWVKMTLSLNPAIYNYDSILYYKNGLKPLLLNNYEKIIENSINIFEGVSYISPTMELDGPLYNKKVIYCIANEKEIGLSTKNVTIKFPETLSKYGSFLLIPKLSNLSRIIAPIKSESYNLQELYGVNSIDAILNRLTADNTILVQNQDVDTLTLSLLTFNYLDVEYGVDYKIIPYGPYDGNNYLFTRTNENGVLFDSTNNIFNTKNNEWEINGLIEQENYSDIDNKRDFKVYIYLFDEDEGVCNFEPNSNTQLTTYHRQPYFYPTPPTCSLNFPTDDNLTINERTNGLISNVTFGFKSNSNDGILNQFANNATQKLVNIKETINTENSYFYSPIAYMDFNDESIGNTTSLTPLVFTKEAFAIQSQNYIVVNGIPHGCNDEFYLTGNMVLHQLSDNQEYRNDFCLYIGVRKLNDILINKITHMFKAEDLKTSTNSYISMTSDYSFLINNQTHEYITPTIESIHINKLGYFEDPINDKGLIAYANKMPTTLDIIKKMMCIDSPSLHAYMLSKNNNATWGEFYELVKNDIYDISNDEVFREILGTEIQRRVRKIGIERGGALEYFDEHEKNIRLVEYPTYESESSTELVVVKGICVNDDRRILIIHLSDEEYDEIGRCWDLESTIDNVSGNYNNLQYAYYTTTGIRVSEYGNCNLYYYNEIRNDYDSLIMNVGEDYRVISDLVRTTFGKYKEESLNANMTISDIDDVPFYQLTGMISTVDTVRSVYKEGFIVQPYGIIKFDFEKYLFYLDLSMHIVIPASCYNKLVEYGDITSDFSVRIGYCENNYTEYIHPFILRENQHATYTLKDGVIDCNFRIYETNKVPFNVDGLHLNLEVNTPLINFLEEKYNVTITFEVSKILLNDNTSYRKEILHINACVDKEGNIIEEITQTPLVINNNNAQVSSSTNNDSFALDTTGIKLINSSGITKGYEYAAYIPHEQTILSHITDNNPTHHCTISSSIVYCYQTNIEAGTSNAVVYPFGFPYIAEGSTTVRTQPLINCIDLTGTTIEEGKFYLLHTVVGLGNGEVAVATIYDGEKNVKINLQSTPNAFLKRCDEETPICLGIASNKPSAINNERLYGIYIKYISVGQYTDHVFNNFYQ